MVASLFSVGIAINVLMLTECQIDVISMLEGFALRRSVYMSMLKISRHSLACAIVYNYPLCQKAEFLISSHHMFLLNTL